MSNTRTKFQTPIKNALLAALYEYLLITFPVGLYVLLEASHKDDPAYYFILSPEWSIATIFLCFQGLSLYIHSLRQVKRDILETPIQLFALISLGLIVASAVNAYHSLSDTPAHFGHSSGNSSIGANVLRISLFCIVSLAFLTVVGSGKYTQKTQSKSNEEEIQHP